MEKEFEQLTTEEMANLTEEDIQAYMTQGWSENEIRMEVASCKKILASL